MTPEVEAAFELYAQHRRELKKPLTPTAQKMALKKIEEFSGGNPRRAVAIIHQTIENGWLGIFTLTKDSEERFLANERERLRTKRIKCEYCGKEITEDGRRGHEDSECPNFKNADPGRVAGAVKFLGEKWGVN